MKIVAMLAWWDEPVEDLVECIKTLPVLCDSVVAVDGAYQMTPGAKAYSHSEQAEAIRATAEKVDLEVNIIVPKKIWVGQVEKRDFMLREAAKEADWLLAVDADHRLVGNRVGLRKEIGRLSESFDSIRHQFHTPMPQDPKELKLLSPHSWHTGVAGKTIEHSLLFRRLDDMRVERVHWGYSGLRRDGTRVSVGNWRDPNTRSGRYYKIRQPFRIDHVCFTRDRMRLDRNRTYCRKRDDFKRRNGYEP